MQHQYTQGYPSHQGYPPQQGYPPHQGYPPQQGYPQQGYQQLTVLSAVYGKRDVTQKVAQFVNGNNLRVSATNEVLSDGWPGIKKVLSVTYAYPGQPPRVAIVEEGQVLSI
ncbi:fhaA [Acrasis kona]|uniref:FhaA n=1 Tax=Acrasis kona TaxID=1008807 RepID=A0AAW2YVD7_9EUKA